LPQGTRRCREKRRRRDIFVEIYRKQIFSPVGAVYSGDVAPTELGISMFWIFYKYASPTGFILYQIALDKRIGCEQRLIMNAEVLAQILIFAGIIISLLGLVRILVAAYKVSVIWFIVSLFFFGWLLFVIFHFEKAWRPFSIWLLGIMVTLLGMAIRDHQFGL
jgi:hypothetical protein